MMNNAEWREKTKSILKGTIHGKTVQLDVESGLPDGQAVNVTLEPTPAAESVRSAEAWDALQRAAGTWSDDVDGLDRYLEWNRYRRKVTRPEIPE